MGDPVYCEALREYQHFRKNLSSVKSKSDFITFLHNSQHLLVDRNEHGIDEQPGKQLPVMVRKKIRSRFYVDICNDIIEFREMPWLHKDQRDVQNIFDSIFLNGPGKDLLLLLISKFSEHSCHTKVLEEASRLLCVILHSQKMIDMLWEECKVTHKLTEQRNNAHGGVVFDEKFVTILCSLPDRVLNKLDVDVESLIRPHNYFTRLTDCICQTLVKVHDNLSSGKDCSILLLSRLFAKICVLRHDSDLFDILLPKMEEWISSTPLWSRICSYFFLKCPPGSLDGVVEPLLKRHVRIGIISALLDDGILTNQKLKFLLTHKFFFVKMYKDDNVPFNIFAYLNDNVKRQSFVLDIFLSLLRVWGDKYALNGTSIDQHYYISRCISMAVWFLGKEKMRQNKSEIMKILLNAMSVHLESPIERIRKQGMTMAEIITKNFDEKDHTLKFDFERDLECDYLKSLSENPPSNVKINSNENDRKKEILPPKIKKEDVSRENNVTSNSFDSDDDFEPYDMDSEDEDKTVNGVRSPLYVRDCLTGIMSKDDPNRLEASLKVFEKLIWNEKDDLEDVAVDIAKILLYLDDQYGLDNFSNYRFNSMVAICCKCPVSVSSYLTREFYAENYNIRQRLDMLEVLSAAANILSKPGHGKYLQESEGLPLPKVMYSKSKPKSDWKVVIEERLKRKTKIISKARAKHVEPSSNQFANCAGYFFFPLLKSYDSPKLSFDFLGQDSFLLGRLIYAVGSIIHCASGLQITHQMALSAFEVIWNLRFHREPFIRQSLIYLFCMVLVSCNPSILFSDYSKEIFDGKEWLEDVLKLDADRECQQLAAHCHAILESTLKTAVNQN